MENQTPNPIENHAPQQGTDMLMTGLNHQRKRKYIAFGVIAVLVLAVAFAARPKVPNFQDASQPLAGSAGSALNGLVILEPNEEVTVIAGNLLPLQWIAPEALSDIYLVPQNGQKAILILKEVQGSQAKWKVEAEVTPGFYWIGIESGSSLAKSQALVKVAPSAASDMAQKAAQENQQQNEAQTPQAEDQPIVEPTPVDSAPEPVQVTEEAQPAPEELPMPVEEVPAPEELPMPVEEVPAPEEVPMPVEEVPAPVEEVQPIPEVQPVSSDEQIRIEREATTSDQNIQ